MNTARLKKIIDDDNTKKLEILKSKILGDPEIKIKEAPVIEKLRKQVANLVEALELDFGCTKKEIQEYLER